MSSRFSFKPMSYVLIVIAILAIVYKAFYPSAFAIQVTSVYAPISGDRWLGADSLGRDYLARLIVGTGNSLLLISLALLTTLVVGTVYGILLCVSSNKVSQLGMRTLDVYASIPHLPLVILSGVVLHEFAAGGEWLGFFVVVISLSLNGWPLIARTVFGEFQRLLAEPFVQSSFALGANRLHVLRVQMWPHLQTALITLLASQVPAKIMTENLIGIIGLGLPDPQPSLGKLLAQSWGALNFYPHLMLAPAVVVTAVGFGVMRFFDQQFRR
jgi:oligopeptide transport system permease protein